MNAVEGSPPTELGVAEAADAVRRGAISAAGLAEALLARIEGAGALNAFISLDADRVLRAAREVDAARAAGKPLGRLAGVPLVIKDNIHVAGLPNTAGTPGLREFRPPADAPVVAALRREGAIVLGKTNMHELAFGITSVNEAFGAVPTPYDLARFAGGSSGGSAAAIAARLAPGGLGTDTGGSVRIPAALTGIAGFRPTAGRYAQAGITPIAASRDTAGPMARCVGDLMLLDEVIAGAPQDAARPPAPEGLRLGLERSHFWADLDTELQAVMDEALDRLKAGGVDLVEIEMPGFAALNRQVGFPVSFHEARRELSRYLGEWPTGLDLRSLAAGTAGAAVREIIEALLGPPALSEAAYRTAIDRLLPAFRQLYADSFAQYRLDALAFPTTPLPAQPIAGAAEMVTLNGRKMATFEVFLRNTYPGASAGLPGLSLPAGMIPAGLPVGLELDGRPGADRRLLASGLALEALLPRLPPPAWRS
jgi:indoleacetamide hydrolase